MKVQSFVRSILPSLCLACLVACAASRAEAPPAAQPTPPTQTQAVSSSTPAPPSEPRGLAEEDFLLLFLTAADFSNGMRQVQDTRLQGPDPGDRDFARNRGVMSGFTAWMAADSEPVWRVVDIRWTFPDADAAHAYINEGRQKIAEGQPEVSGAEAVGEDCRVFGGTMDTPFGTKITNYFYTFRVGNVVVKLYAAQGPELERPTLTPTLLAPIAKAIVKRVQ